VRRKDDTLRDTLLNIAQSMADTEGIEAVNIRSIAKKAGIASGTVYNYFSNKDEILLALTEVYWNQALSEMRNEITAESFCEQLQEIFYFLQERIDKSAGKLMNSLGNAEVAGQAHMASAQSALEETLIQRMEQDTRVREDVWNETFTKEQFARFIMMNMTMLLRARASDISFFITVIRRIIYEVGEEE